MVKKINAVHVIDTGELVKKTDCNTKYSRNWNKIPTVINILPIMVLISFQVQYLMKD